MILNMNFSTHLMFGILFGALFFGNPEVILLVAIGSMIPDLDREYGFLNKESFRNRQIHRALCHNFLFIGLVYLINPYLAIGAFLHVLLDTLTAARDRGVEWLYPFTRLVNRAVYDYNGDRMELDPRHKIYFLQNELPMLTEKTTKDLKPDQKTLPWRRSYGPALSGRILDKGILAGSAALTVLLLLFSVLGFHQFVDLSSHEISLSFILPLAIAAVGGFMNYAVGEIDRKRLLGDIKLDRTYKTTFFISDGIMIFSLILGAIMNPQIVISTISEIPYISAGVAVILFVSFVVLKINTSKPLPSDNTKEPPII